MRRLLFTLLLASLITLHYAQVSPVQASIENADMYNNANELYTNKEYHEALVLYQELVDRGVQNPLLYYNLANTYFKIGDLGNSVLYFERALRLKPFDRDIRANLNHVRSQLEDKIRPLYDEGLLRVLRRLFAFPNIKTIVYVEILLFAILVILLLCFLFLPHSRIRLKNPIIIVGALYVVILLGMISQFTYENRYPQGILLQKEVAVKSSPLVESETLFSLHEGCKIRLIENRGEWIRFSIQDGRQGWMMRESVAFIREK